MQQLSISEIQRNLRQLDEFDIIEIVDKKRHKVKGYFVDSKYVAFIKELIAKTNNDLKEQLGGSLQQYGASHLQKREKDAWKKHTLEKYSL